MKKAFHGGIVPAISFAAHRTDQAMLADNLSFCRLQINNIAITAINLTPTAKQRNISGCSSAALNKANRLNLKLCSELSSILSPDIPTCPIIRVYGGVSYIEARSAH
jgi:hypothetical protein